MKYFILSFLVLLSFIVKAQKTVIDHTVYNDWKKVGDSQISNQGKFSSYTIKPHRGDGYLYIVNNETGKKDSIFRGEKLIFSASEKWCAFKITPGFDTLRNCELNKVKKDKWPKDSLGIYFLETDSLVKIPQVKSFLLHENMDLLAYLSDRKLDNTDKSKKKRRLFGKKKSSKDVKSDGKMLFVLNPISGKEQKWNFTQEYVFSNQGPYLIRTEHKKYKTDSISLGIINLTDYTEKKLGTAFTSIDQIAFHSKSNQAVVIATIDTVSTAHVYALYHVDSEKGLLQKVADSIQINSKIYTVSQHFAPYFSEKGDRLFFGFHQKPIVEPKDSLLESEKVKLDVWHWKDDRLQPQQLVELKKDQKKSLLFVYDFTTKASVQLGSDTLNVRVLAKGDADYALAWSVEPYEASYNWDFPNKRDYYRISLTNSKIEILKRAMVYQVSLSPDGNFFYYYDEKDKQQYLLDVVSNSEICITCSRKDVEWLEDVNGMPHVPAPFGLSAWTKDSKSLILESKYDIWEYNVGTKSLLSVTNEKGFFNKERLKLNFWTTDSVYFHIENIYITGFLEKDKSMSIWAPVANDKSWNLSLIYKSSHEFSGFKRAKFNNTFLFQKSSLVDYPDVYSYSFTGENRFEPRRISHANPQQVSFNWATVELLEWKSYSGLMLEGLLYKPENYDPNKKYPMLVYFYELYSDDLHKHYAPKPTASIIFPTEYASAGYFVFIPDIRYKEGFPAKGAYDCIMSGTDAVLRKYPSVDSTRLGLQGQSWGGYQTAQLITMTTRYKAAMAGAPVANMFSAYGGIRWGSGLNRQFQYERTQSRIGKTIWEAPELYVENSPLFHLPNVRTPLLIMHNDGDGAVPWYQSIELFTGLKRLNKPVWLLNYNEDDHNLMKNANRMDLSIRMRQFFDFYLNNGTEPVWLKEGVPALKKGK
jgi:dipeptidyl aminopeptidase/acylaminoacyl peptidase